MFVGRYDNSIDDNNRMFMPSKYCEDFDVYRIEGKPETAEKQTKPGKLRKDYEGKCVIVHGAEHCLYAFTLQGWENFIEELNVLPDDDENIRDLLRHYYTSASYCDIDKQGRVTIPPIAREYAGIVRELATVGMNKLVEIWDRKTYERTISGKDVKALSNYASQLKRGAAAHKTNA